MIRVLDDRCYLHRLAMLMSLDLLGGKPISVVANGKLTWEKRQAENMTEFEFFMALGPVRLAFCLLYRSFYHRPPGRGGCLRSL